MDDVAVSYDETITALVDAPGRIFVVGGIDSGKTTFTRRLAEAGLAAGHPVAVVDADLGQSTIGPPGTVGLKIVTTPDDLDPSTPIAADALSFVGTVSPRGHFLPLAAGTAKLVMRAIELGARLIVVDTSGLVSGLGGQVLKLTKAELCRPHHVVAIAHGLELDPIVEVLERFLSLDVRRLPVHPEIAIRAVDERTAYREQALASALGPDVYRWRIKPTVFFPTLPPDFDLSRLEHLLVGVDDGRGDCLGLGILEYREETLRLLTPVSEGVRALRLGSVRVSQQGKITDNVDIRSMFGTD